MISNKYLVVFSKNAERDFQKLEKKNQSFLLQKLMLLEQSADPFHNTVKLTGTKDKYRLLYGQYRVIFTPESDGTLVILLLLKIGHRKNIYA